MRFLTLVPLLLLESACRKGEEPATGRIAFLSERNFNSDIYVMNADGSGLTRLTNDPAFDTDPAWSPDGSQIAFHSLRDGNLEIYVMNADGSGVTPSPSCGPRGSLVVRETTSARRSASRSWLGTAHKTAQAGPMSGGQGGRFARPG